MRMKFIGSLAIAFLLIGCNRQPKVHTASAAGPDTATASPTQSPSPDPEPVAKTAAPIEATIPPADPDSTHAVRVTIPARTRIRVRLAETLDTRRTWVGERFTAYLDEPIVSGNRVVIPKGTTFAGRVVESRSSGRLKGRAYLGVTLDTFQLGGATYKIATDADFRASRSHKRRNLALIGGGSGSGAAIGAVAGGGLGALVGAGAGAAAGTTGALITGRKNVRLPAETTLLFSLRSPLKLGA